MPHPAIPFVAWLRLIARPTSPRALICGIALTVALSAAAPTMNFDLPADSAEKALRQFSQQSGLEVVFASGIAKDVRTKLVRGEMPARTALDAMLADTGLVVFQDQ